MILNLTMHEATGEQINAGVSEPSSADKNLIKDLLVFDDLPDNATIGYRAECLTDIARTYAPEAALIGGAPYLMSSLERALLKEEIIPLYAFSKRESIEEIQSDGSIAKKNIFRHLGFVRPDDL